MDIDISDKQSAKILVLDDDELITKTIKLLLKAQTSYDVFLFNSASDALEFLKENDVDLVISDFMMPEMNGIEFLNEVKKIRPSVTTILLTGYADKENAIKAINEVGIYKYIEKPWDNDELILNIKNGVERSQLVETVKIQKEIERLRSDFIATLTHDLRTPLHADIQTLEYFLDGTLGNTDEKQKKFLSAMLRSNQDMLSLVNNLLEVYKLESGTKPFLKEEFDLADLIRKCLLELESIFKNKNILLSENIPENCRVYADKQEIKRVVINFLGNALTHAKKEITVSLEQNSVCVRFSVKDDGEGISSEDAKKLFNRFSQGSSKKRSAGTGLGLYLSRQIIEAHGGRTGLDSNPGAGSEFYFELSESYKGVKNE